MCCTFLNAEMFVFWTDFPYDDKKFEVTDEMKKCFDEQGYLLLR